MTSARAVDRYSTNPKRPRFFERFSQHCGRVSGPDHIADRRSPDPTCCRLVSQPALSPSLLMLAMTLQTRVNLNSGRGFGRLMRRISISDFGTVLVVLVPNDLIRDVSAHKSFCVRQLRSPKMETALVSQPDHMTDLLCRATRFTPNQSYLLAHHTIPFHPIHSSPQTKNASRLSRCCL